MGFLSGLLQKGEQALGIAHAPAPQQKQAVATLPAPGQQHSMNPFQRIGNTLHNDIVAPVQRDLIQPTAHAIGNVQHAAGNTVNALSTHSLNNVANSNFNPTHLVQNYAVKPGMELGAGIGQNVYNHGIAPALNLPKQNLTNAFPHSQEAQRIAHLSAGQQAANALNLASNALPGGGKIVDALAGKAAAGIADKVGGNVAANVLAKTAGAGIKVGGNAAIGGGMGYGLGASNTLLNGGNLKQANQAGLQNAKIGAVLGGAGTAAAEAAPHVIQGAKTATAMAKNYGLKPPTNLTPAELAASNKVINGNPMELTSQDTKLFHQAQTKLVPPDQVGTAHGMNAASDALNAHAAYNTAVQQRAAQVQAVKQNLQQGVKQLATDQSGKALVSEDGSVIPTIKNALGKGQTAPVEATTSPVFYKGFNPNGKTAGNAMGKGFYVTPLEQRAKDYANGGVVKQYHLAPDAKTIDINSPKYKAIKEANMVQVPGGEPGYMKPNHDAINKQLQKQGYDVVSSTHKGETLQMAVLNKNKLIERTPSKPAPVETPAVSSTPKMELASKMQSNYTGVNDARNNDFQHVRVVKNNSSGKFQIAYKDAGNGRSGVFDKQFPTVDDAFKNAKFHDDHRTNLNASVASASTRTSGVSSTPAPSTKPTDSAAAVQPKLTSKPAKAASEAGSVALPKSTPEDIGKALGMSPKDVATAQAANLSPADKAELTPKEQMLLHSADTPLRTPEQNRALNPVKSGLQHVPQDNHDMAISQSQMVHNDVMLHGSQVLTAFDKLNKGEQSNFMRSVEKLPADASPKLKEAVSRWKAGANTVHAHSQSEVLGGNTNYLKNYALHSWDLPADFGATDHVINGGGKDFQGLNNISRIHATIADGESSGLKLNSDPKAVRKQIEGYFGGSANALRKQTLRTGMAEADAGHMEKTGHLTLGVGDTVPLSKQGLKAAKGVQWSPKSTNKAVVGYRKANRGMTSVLLTHSGVHELNITSRAAPGLALKGHPLAALKAAAGGVRGNLDKGYIDNIRQKALEDGTASKAAMMGAPYSTGHGLLDRQLTPIHDQVVRSVIHDLEKKNIPLDSAAARSAGKAASGMMGEVNYQLAHMSPQHSRLLGDVFLAKQFTPSKFMRAGQAVSDTGLGGHYARATMAGNALLATATIAGLGYAFKQKSDNLKDSLIRAILAPSVPTPIKDGKGNNQQVRLLGTDTSDIAKLLGITMTRQQDGHLGISWNAKNVPSTTADYFRSRLSPMLGDAAKVATNTNYAGKPLFDPSAPAGTKAIQAGTTLLTGHLPIAAQTLAYSKAVKSVLPGSAQTILNANTPKSNVATNAALGLLGGAVATDKTVGKGLQSSQYYAAVDAAKKGLNANDLAAYNAVHPATKNPVTGTFQTTPTIYDSQAKATAYLSHPNVLAADNKLNQTLASQGQAIDPFYKLSADQQNIALNYSALASGDYRRSNFLKAYPFLNQLSNDRNSFFSSLPAGGTTDTAGNSKPALPANLQYPNLSPAEQALSDKYYNATTSQKKVLLQDPATASAVNKVKTYSANIASTRRIPTASQIPNTSTSTTKKTSTGVKTSKAKSYKGTSPASIAAAYSTGKSTKALGFDKTLNSLSSKAKLGMTVKTRSAGSVKALRAYKAPKAPSSKVKLGSRGTMPKKVYA